MNNPSPEKFRRALVIGGTSGIGYALAQGLLSEGYTTSIVGKNREKLERAVDSLRQGGDVKGYCADVSRPAEIESLYGRLRTDDRLPEVLINCQGGTILKPCEEFTVAEYDFLMDVNLKSVFLCCQIFGRRMLAEGNGNIINVASLAAHRGWPLAAVYSIAKHGIVGLTKTFAAEWAERGIRVNAVSPGFFITELNRDKMSGERKHSAISRTPARRFGELSELVGAVLFLAGDNASFITGTVMNIDGGYLAGGI